MAESNLNNPDLYEPFTKDIFRSKKDGLFYRLREDAPDKSIVRRFIERVDDNEAQSLREQVRERIREKKEKKEKKGKR